MFIEATKLINIPVAAEDTLAKVGEVSQIVVNPEDGVILGFVVTRGGLFSKPLVLSVVDVKFWDPAGLVTASESNLVSSKEIVRIKNLLDRKFNLLDLPAQTESGKSLGRVENYLIDIDTSSVAKYYLKDILGHARVMPADQVIKIDKTIIFADDEGAITNGLTETQTA